MTKIIVLLMLGFFCCSFATADARKNSITDTVYYYLDIEKTPVNDRMVKVDSFEFGMRYVTINCRCLQADFGINFTLFKKRESEISKKAFGKLKIITLLELIDMARANNNWQFNDRIKIFFVEKRNGKFMTTLAYYRPVETVE